MLFGAIGAKRFVFPCRKIGEGVVRPDLTMRVRVAGAHQFAAVFEDLDVMDPGDLREHGELPDPGIDDTAQCKRAHSRDGEIVARREAQDAADATIGLCYKQIPLLILQRLDIRQKRGKIVLKDVRLRILRSLLSVDTFVSGTEITVWIVGDRRRRWKLFYFSLPGAIHSLRRDHNPFPQERIEAFVRSGKEFFEIHN